MKTLGPIVRHPQPDQPVRTIASADTKNLKLQSSTAFLTNVMNQNNLQLEYEHGTMHQVQRNDLPGSVFAPIEAFDSPGTAEAFGIDYSALSENGEEVLNILLIEDDEETAEYALNGLTQAGHVVNAVADGKEGLVHCLDTEYDLLIVDRMLPGMDGLAMIKAARASGVKTPALFLTALSGVDDRVAGLEAGADDYLTKPFAFSELLARVNALGRRPAVSTETTSLTVGDLTMDLLKRTVTRGSVDIDLQPREFLLLEVLMRNEGRIVSRTMLLEKVWDFHFDPKTSVVETHISRLRSKIDKPFDTQLLHTSRNIGYSLHLPR